MPAITRLALEGELAERVSGLMTFVGKSATASGTNVSFGAAIGWATQLQGYQPATPGSVADSDLAGVPTTLFYPLADLAEYRLIESCLGNYLRPDELAQDRMQAWGKLREQFAARAKELALRYKVILNPRQAPTLVGPSCSRFPTPGRPGWGLGHGRHDH